VTENTRTATEDQAFMTKLWQYRATLSTREQEMLDALVLAAGHQQDDVQGYVLFGSGTPFGGTNPFGGSAPYGGTNTFGSGTSFGTTPPQ
jgi:hypothetical protein